MKVCLGGTFDPFHAGHKALLRRAFQLGDEVFVGVTEGTLANRPDREVSDIEDRIATIEEFAAAAKFAGSLLVRPLADASGPAATEPYDIIVVTPETVPGAQRINEKRTARGLRPLQVDVLPHVLAQDRLPISATRISAGVIDARGERLTPLRIAVGSANPVKVAGARKSLRELLDISLDVHGVSVPSGVAEQPIGAATLDGARTRAQKALEAVPGAEYGIGIEAGLIDLLEAGTHYDMQACVILDRDGRETIGWGPAFTYPDAVTRRALEGEMISDILGPIADDPRIGGTTGAVGYLSDGAMDRTQLTASAVIMAFLPRVRRALYDGVMTSE